MSLHDNPDIALNRFLSLVLIFALIGAGWWLLRAPTPDLAAPLPEVSSELDPGQTELSPATPAETNVDDGSSVPDQRTEIEEAVEPDRTSGAAEEVQPGFISGVLLLDSHKPVDTFRWTIRIEGPGMSWPMNKAELERTGRFRSKGLTAGTYRVVAEHHNMPLAAVEGIEVTAGKVIADPRINPWRAEQSSREMRVQIKGAPGNSGATNVWAVNPQNRILGHARWEGSERILRCAQGAAPDVLIFAPGFAPQRIAWQDGLVEVTLDKGIEVELQAVAPVKMADGIRRGWFVLRPETGLHGVSPMQFDVGFSATDLIAGKSIQLRLPAAAGYELRFAGDRNDGPGFIPMYQKVIQSGLIITTSGGVQKLLIALPDPLTEK